MERLTCRLLPYSVDDGPTNMAQDEALLQSATRGVTSIRFYEWKTATISLGYFQRAADRLADPLLARLPFVRRPTGGDAIVHHHELTYCLAVPSTRCRAIDGTWLHMHEIIAATLGDFGVTASPYTPWEPSKSTRFPCFQHFTAGDLLVNAAKVVGSAQRKQRGARMQHGSILLARSEFASCLPGIEDLSGVMVSPTDLYGAIVDRMSLHWDLVPDLWTKDEMEAITDLVRERYSTDEWNLRR